MKSELVSVTLRYVFQCPGNTLVSSVKVFVLLAVHRTSLSTYIHKTKYSTLNSS